MAFTYGETDSDRDTLRRLIGDRDASRAQWSDAECDIYLSDEGSVLLAGAEMLDNLATEKARDFDFSADGTSFKKGTVSAQLAKRASRLRARAKSASDGVIMPLRQDGYSDSISSEEATLAGTVDFDRGRFD